MVESAGRELDIDGFTWLAEIGSGGFGSVHRARDEDHGRDVAIKVLHASLDERSRARFDRERRLMGSVSGHPNIVTIHTSGFTGTGVPYIVMELIAGGTLGDALAGQLLDWPTTVDLGLKLGSALEAAHDAGVLHLDIKPDNVLIGVNREPLLADFGIASSMSEIAFRNTISISPFYSPPEVLNNVGVDARSDVYSLACTLFTCLTGERPYERDGVMASITAMASEPTPRAESPGIPATLTALLAEAMDKELDGRPTSMKVFTSRLAGLQPSSPNTQQVEHSTSTAPHTIVHPKPDVRPHGSVGSVASASVASAGNPSRVPPPPTSGPPPVLAASSASVLPPPSSPSKGSRWKVPAIVAGVVLLGLGGLVSLTGINANNDRPDAVTNALADLGDITSRPIPTPPDLRTEVSVPPPTTAPGPTRVPATPVSAAAPTTVPLSALVPDLASNIVWSEGIDDQDRPVGVFQGTIPPNTRTVCVSFTLAEPVSGELEYVFRFPGFEDDFNAVIPSDIDFFDDQWWACYDARGVCGTCTIPLGLVDFEFVDNGEFVFGVGRHVGFLDFHIARVVNSSTTAAFCGVWIGDAASANFWQNELARPLLPGEFVELSLPASTYDIQINDCEGELFDTARFDLEQSRDLLFG